MEICINKPMEVVWKNGDGEARITSVVLDHKNTYDAGSLHNLENGYVWVKAADGSQFGKLGNTIVFKKSDGTPPFGYSKPATLRNVQEDQSMSEYHDFIPYGAASFPPFPFTAKFINVKGEVHELTVSSAGMLPNTDRIVAVAFQKVDPLRVEAQRLLDAANKRGPFGTSRRLIEEVLRIQQEESKPDHGKMPTWFLALLEECGIFTSAHRMDVWNWYMDTHNSNTTAWKLPTALARKLDNRLLSFRPWSGGGQLVITPYGHGLAVTNAKKVYWLWKDRDFRTTYGMGSHENNGGYKPNYAKRTITINSKGVEIGCQKIPHMAFTRLAERLGWPDKDPYGY